MRRILSALALGLILALATVGAAEAAIALAVSVTADDRFQEQLATELRRRLAGVADVHVVPRDAADFSLEVIATGTGDDYVAAAEFSALFTRDMALRLLSAVDRDRAGPLIAWLQTFEQERWRGVYAFSDPRLLAERIATDLDRTLEDLRGVAPSGNAGGAPD